VTRLSAGSHVVVTVFVIVLLLKLASERLGFANILLLRRLIATRKQDDIDICHLNEVHAVPGTMIYAKLGNALANRLDVASVPERQPTDTDVDARLRRSIPKRSEPLGVQVGLTNLEHAHTVSHGIRPGKVALLSGAV